MGLWGSGVRIPPLRPGFLEDHHRSVRKRIALKSKSVSMSANATPLISLIAAMDRSRVIGRNGTIPWHFPHDLRRFRQLTWGKPILMGRCTFVSIGRPLPGRHNIILTRSADLVLPGCSVVNSPEAAIAAAGAAKEIMVIGGASLYTTFLGQADRIYLTELDGDFGGDTYFPMLLSDAWRLVERACHRADANHVVDYCFVTLRRRGEEEPDETC